MKIEAKVSVRGTENTGTPENAYQEREENIIFGGGGTWLWTIYNTV